MKLLEPFHLGDLNLKNRMVMAPLTRNRAPNTIPQDLMATYYRQRAGAGLIIAEATQIIPMGQGYPHTPGIHSEAQIAAWQKITDEVHKAGGLIFLQLWHVGRISHSSYHGGKAPVSASDVRYEGNIMYPDFSYKPSDESPRGLELEEIPGLIDDYRKAAQNAQNAGFDGIEIHAANGYLIEQFLRTGTNKRSDNYGDSLENRLRLLKEITEAALSVWDSKRVGVRLSPNIGEGSKADANPQETYSAAAELLSSYNLAFLHTVEANLGNSKASDLMRKAYTGTHLVTGGLTKESGEKLLEDGIADLAGYGKLFIANPDLAERFKQNADLNAWDSKSFFGGAEEGYTDYPSLKEAQALA
ncbi:MAG: alkene reductase [Trueperaceae bacterium]|nr:alkene reductase [Trueperaceae bacterium]